MDTTSQIESLKELILVKFAELEKRLELQADNTNLKLEAIRSKDAEQDARLCTLEQKQAPKNWKQDLALWAVKGLIIFIIGLLLLWARSGFPAIGK